MRLQRVGLIAAVEGVHGVVDAEKQSKPQCCSLQDEVKMVLAQRAMNDS